MGTLCDYGLVGLGTPEISRNHLGKRDSFPSDAHFSDPCESVHSFEPNPSAFIPALFSFSSLGPWRTTSSLLHILIHTLAVLRVTSTAVPCLSHSFNNHSRQFPTFCLSRSIRHLHCSTLGLICFSHHLIPKSGQLVWLSDVYAYASLCFLVSMLDL